ncbi:MAG: hypothetical protein MRJ68_08580 [Nitrospira sp.]|nr:hypothetical protein [Nitrospira sp.]
MIAIWNNPEWVRHRRALLRPAPTMAIVAVSWLLCALVAYVDGIKHTTLNVILAHTIILPLLVGSTCSQSIMHERVFQTFDFWRTTRLTPRELIAGQLFGVPLRGILAVISTLPIALLSIGFGVSPLSLTLEYLMVLLFCVTVGLGGLVISMFATSFRESRGIAWVWGIALVLFSIGFALADTGRHGFWVMTITPYPFFKMLELAPGADGFSLSQSTSLFGVMPVPRFLLGIVLNLSLSGWFYLMLSRNLKKEPDEIRLLSRWQAVGFATFIALLSHAFGPSSQPTQLPFPEIIEQSFYLLNISTLYFIGIIMLSPAERLHVWWRHWSSGNASYLHEDGFPWPWVVVTAICLSGVTYVSTIIGGWSCSTLLWNLGLAMVFVIRDISFLQWCLCQNFRRPLFTGVLYLGLYYFAALILTPNLPAIHSVLVPPIAENVDAVRAIVTLLLHGLIAGMLLHILTAQLKKPATSGAPLNGET